MMSTSPLENADDDLRISKDTQAPVRSTQAAISGMSGAGAPQLAYVQVDATATRQRRGWVCAHISSRGSDYSEELGGACLQVISTQKALEQWSWGELKGKSGYLYGKANFIRGSGASD